MPKTKSGDDKTHGDRIEPLAERARQRSSPGSGEDEDKGDDQAADLQPDDVENEGPAR